MMAPSFVEEGQTQRLISSAKSPYQESLIAPSFAGWG
jgi:hypothetical protein